jgi:hypothetical protein
VVWLLERRIRVFGLFGLLQPSASWLAATPFAPGMGDK